MAASGTCFTSFDAVLNEPVLWNSNMEATEEETELAWARIADIFGLNKHVRSGDNNVIVIVIHF